MKTVNLKQKLDELYKEGKEIKVKWEGGNDSGGYTVYLDGEELAWGDPFGEAVSDAVSDTMDYGSWAGDWWADGEACYSPEEEAFVGSGKEVTNDTEVLDDSITIRVPKILNFESINIDTTGDFIGSDGGVSASVRFVINNGPVFEEHTKLETQLSDYISEQILDLTDAMSLGEDKEIQSCYNDWVINREDMREEEDHLVFEINDISVGYGDVKWSDHYITISEDVEYTID